jgi:3-hydroxyacyl-CoA dehydrogenase
MQTPHEVVIIGADATGLSIAAHFANVGCKVLVLDSQNERLSEGIPKLKSSLYLPEYIDRIEHSLLRDGLDGVSNPTCVFASDSRNTEELNDLLILLGNHYGPDTFIGISSSLVALTHLVEESTSTLAGRLFICHFARPIQSRRFVEVSAHPSVQTEKEEAFTRFLQDNAGLRTFSCPYSPGLVSQRLGIVFSTICVLLAEKLHLTVEQVEAMTSILGFTGFSPFKFIDQIGLTQVSEFLEALSSPSSLTLTLSRSMRKLLEPDVSRQITGRGYYRGEGSDAVVFDLTTYAYRQIREHGIASIEALTRKPVHTRIKEALELRDELGEFTRNLIPALGLYIEKMASEPSLSLEQIDSVMQRCYTFEVLPSDIVRLSRPTHENAGTMTRTKSYEPNESPIIVDDEGFVIRDLDDGVVQLATKRDRIDHRTVRSIDKWLASQNNPLVVFSGSDLQFGLGYDLEELSRLVSPNDKQDLETYLDDLSSLCKTLSNHRCVSAISGKCLGYHLELALSCTAIVASADTFVGLNHASYGLIPACGGASRLRMEHQEQGAKRLSEVAITIGTAHVAVNALEAQKLGLLRMRDTIVHHPDRLIDEAKRVALDLTTPPPKSWKQSEGPLGGMIDRIQQTYRAKGLTAYDELISDKIKGIFVRPKSWEEALELERIAFLELSTKALSQARIRYMVTTGKALRN